MSDALTLRGNDSAWVAAIADDELRRHYHLRSFDDRGWQPVVVPSHWSTQPGFDTTDGPVLYRTGFEATLTSPNERVWLVFDGLMYQGDIWLDEQYMGATEGYFFRHSVEITAALAERTEHLLALEVACPPQLDPQAKRSLTGAFQPGVPVTNPGGIWRPVRIERTGPVRARSLRVRCIEATEFEARLSLSCELETDAPRAATVVTTVVAPDGSTATTASTDRELADGSNLVEWNVDIAEPQRWWPHSLGDQPLYEVQVEVVIDGEVSHRLVRSTGLRVVSMHDFVVHINGEPLFLKGAVHSPSHLDLAGTSPEAIAADVHMARDAGLDMLRLQAHVTRPEFYDAADRAGLVIWQDLPLTGGYARSVKDQAIRQAGRAVDMLAHHPSVVLWCAHDNPDLRLDRSGEPSGGSADSPLASARRASRPLRPSWNRTVLDRAVRKALTAADPSRPAIPHSGADPQPPRFAPTPRHLWFGWETPLARLATFIGRNANAAQFVSAFGAKSVPAHLDISSASPWPSVDLADFCEPDPETSPEGDLRLLSQWTPLRSHSNDREWALGTQEHQAMVVRDTVETLRRLKYRPAGGFAVSRLTDPGPLVSTSLTDHERAPKLAFVALKKVCAPVIVVADRLPDRVRPNSPVALDVHVVSDLRHRIEHARVDAVVAWDDDDYRTGWSGDIEADACVRVGLVRFVTPAVPGTLTVTLKLTVDGEVLSTFDDRTTIFRP